MEVVRTNLWKTLKDLTPQSEDDELIILSQVYGNICNNNLIVQTLRVRWITMYEIKSEFHFSYNINIENMRWMYIVHKYIIYNNLYPYLYYDYSFF